MTTPPKKPALQQLYVWSGVGFIWIGAFFGSAQVRCQDLCDWPFPYVIAGAISAVAMWWTAGSVRDIYKE
jgi:hypothetical protein